MPWVLRMLDQKMKDYRCRMSTDVCVCFTITAKVLETTSRKPSVADTVPKSPTKSPTPSESSSLALSMQAHTSPTTSLTSTEHENPEDAYIMLDECFSGTSSASLMTSTSSGTPSPGTTLGGRSGIPSSGEFRNMHSSGDSKTVDDLPPRHVESPSRGMRAGRSADAIFEDEPIPDLPPRGVESPTGSVRTRRSTDAMFEDEPVPECDVSTDSGIWDGQSLASSTNLGYLMGQSESGNYGLPPALPAKLLAVSDVEYDVPKMGLVHTSAVGPASSPMHGSTASPPQPHMAIPGPMHRYVNAAPVVMRSHTPTSTTQSGPSRPPQNTAKSSSLLPPKAHG